MEKANQQLMGGDFEGAYALAHHAIHEFAVLEPVEDPVTRELYEYSRHHLMSLCGLGTGRYEEGFRSLQKALCARRYDEDRANLDNYLRQAGPSVKKPGARVMINGGLGNKLFQIAMLRGFCRRYPEFMPVFDPRISATGKHDTVNWSYFSKDIGCDDTETVTDCAREPPLSFGQFLGHDFFRALLPTGKPVALLGYFQSEKYFVDLKADIVRDFRPPTAETAYLIGKYPGLRDRAMFVHIRRGDIHPGNTKHYIDLDRAQYYPRALDHFRRAGIRTTYVCSDDLPWCRTQEWIRRLANPVIVDENEIHTLWLMALCSCGGVAANSTFSWWGLYLNTSQHRIAIIPDKVIADAAYDSSDYIPEAFTAIGVT
jgi:hypothetical protein